MTISFFILAIPRTRTILGFDTSGILINVGMWMERYIIITPTLSNPRLPYESAYYHPTFWEWGTFWGSVAGFILLFWLFSKFYPLLSVWELKEGREDAIPEMIERLNSYLPEKNDSQFDGA